MQEADVKKMTVSVAVVLVVDRRPFLDSMWEEDQENKLMVQSQELEVVGSQEFGGRGEIQGLGEESQESEEVYQSQRLGEENQESEEVYQSQLLGEGILEFAEYQQRHARNLGFVEGYQQWPVGNLELGEGSPGLEEGILR